MTKNELHEGFPTGAASKDFVAGLIEAHHLKSSWLGFRTVYRTIVDGSNNLCINIKPQHGKLGFSIVSLEASALVCKRSQ